MLTKGSEDGKKKEEGGKKWRSTGREEVGREEGKGGPSLCPSDLN